MSLALGEGTVEFSLRLVTLIAEGGFNLKYKTYRAMPLTLILLYLAALTQMLVIPLLARHVMMVLVTTVQLEVMIVKTLALQDLTGHANRIMVVLANLIT